MGWLAEKTGTAELSGLKNRKTNLTSLRETLHKKKRRRKTQPVQSQNRKTAMLPKKKKKNTDHKRFKNKTKNNAKYIPAKKNEN